MLLGALLPQQSPVMHDLVLERDHLMDERRVLLRHGVDGFDPGDEIVEAAGAEDDCERRLLIP